MVLNSKAMVHDEFKALQEDIDRRKKLLASKLEALKQEELQLEREQIALATVINMKNRRTFASSSLTGFSFSQGVISSMPLVRFVDEAVESLSPKNGYGTFTMEDVAGYIQKTYPKDFLRFDLETSKPNISRYLSNMAVTGQLTLVKEASGRRPAQYRKPKSSP